MDIPAIFMSASINAFEANKRLGLFVRVPWEPEAGRPQQDDTDPWRTTFRAVGPGTLSGTYLLPYRTDRPGGPNPCRRALEDTHDSKGRVGTVQQSELGTDGAIALVGVTGCRGELANVHCRR